MPKKPLDAEHHVARHLPRRLIIFDRTNRTKVLGCFPDAFRLRQDQVVPGKNEKYLSAAWLECYVGDRRQQLSEILKAMKASGYQFRSGSGFTIGMVGSLQEICLPNTVSALSNPKPGRPSYAEVWGIPQNDDALLGEIGSDVWGEVHLIETLKEEAA